MIKVCPDLERLSAFAADRIAELARRYEPFSIALCGGSTPVRTYELLRDADLDWSQVHVFWGDERYVSPTDARSNERLVREALLDHVDIPMENVHPMFHQGGWEEAAEAYEDELREFFAGRDHTFDLALQGMGDDGHTASIFPDTPVPTDDRWVLTSRGPEDSPQRISLSLECLAQSRTVAFLVAGKSKATRLAQVMTNMDCDLPAARLSQLAVEVEWWLDEGAAGHL